MADSAEFKALVRRRMEATGENYTTAFRALLRAAEREVLPVTGRRNILPRVAAESPDGPADVYVEITSGFRLDLDDRQLAEYLQADEWDREGLAQDWLMEHLEQLVLNGDTLIQYHGIISVHQNNDDIARSEATHLGISPDQYLWLTDRLTPAEWENLSDDAMHRLLADEYRPYQAPGEQ